MLCLLFSHGLGHWHLLTRCPHTGGRPRSRARRGVAWRGAAWRGAAWRGAARRGAAWRGVARRGVACEGAVLRRWPARARARWEALRAG